MQETNILLVEDDRMIIENLTEFLKTEGFQVWSADGQEKAMKILRNQLTVTGTWNSSFTGEVTDDWHMIVHLLKEKKIDPAQFISHRYTLEELNRGFEIMRDKSEDYIKIMAVME